MLLRQPPDERVRRGGTDGALERFKISGEDPQQCALAGAVGAHDSDHIARGDGHIEPLEEGAMGETPSHILRDKRSRHRSIVPSPRGDGIHAHWSLEPC
jgi:hypothetical protein